MLNFEKYTITLPKSLSYEEPYTLTVRTKPAFRGQGAKNFVKNLKTCPHSSSKHLGWDLIKLTLKSLLTLKCCHCVIPVDSFLQHAVLFICFLFRSRNINAYGVLQIAILIIYLYLHLYVYIYIGVYRYN